MILRISSLLLARLRAAAAAAPDREICGLLFGTDGWIEAAQATANVSPVPADSFEIDPAALFAAIRAERGGGARLIGHYHSHPYGPATPSARDAAAAGEAGHIWLILGREDATAWRAVPGGPIAGAFERVILQEAGEAGCA